MGIEAIVAAIICIAGSAGGFFEGRRRGNATNMGIAVDTVELLQVRVAMLAQQGEEKDAKIAILEGKVEVLEGLITQRAEVEAAVQGIMGVRGVVDRIAAKVEA